MTETKNNYAVICEDGSWHKEPWASCVFRDDFERAKSLAESLTEALEKSVIVVPMGNYPRTFEGALAALKHHKGI